MRLSLSLVGALIAHLVRGDDEYDLLIVGGGTSGCVLANRLCQALPELKIGMLEAGAPRTAEEEFAVSVPRYWGLASDYWSSTPTNATGMPIALISGKTLGGSSNLYTNMFTEPPDMSSLEDWGIDGLTAATGRTYMDKAKATLAIPNEAPGPAFRHLYSDLALVAAQAAGIEVVDPTNQESASENLHLTIPMQTATGQRISAYTAYILPLGLGTDGSLCPNLNIIQSATATKIDTDSATKTAIGVTYEVDGTPHSAKASRQVILSAGPYNSVKLLQLSGIGPKSVLETHGIDMVLELPTGVEMKSRPIGQMAGFYAAPMEAAQDPAQLNDPANIQKFMAGEGGPLSHNAISVSGTINGGTAEVSFGPPPGDATLNQTISFHVCSAMLATGSIEIESADPYAFTKVDLNYFDNPAELQQMVTCAETYQKMMGSSDPSVFPWFPAIPAFGEDLTEYFLTNPLGLGNSFDIVGGNAVGKVTDGTLKVMGMENLRVIDSSALPDIPDITRPVSLVYMAAEMMADVLITELDAATDGASTAPSVAPSGAPSSANIVATGLLGLAAALTALVM